MFASGAAVLECRSLEVMVGLPGESQKQPPFVFPSVSASLLSCGLSEICWMFYGVNAFFVYAALIGALSRKSMVRVHICVCSQYSFAK